MLDHISLGVSDMERSKAFYDKALAPLGHKRVHDADFGSGYGPSKEQALFWIGYPLDRSKKAAPSPGNHVAFTAKSRKDVDAFYAAAMAAGARDNGKPGLRPEYTPIYYAAFVLDPDGHNIEAVCHEPA
jgi:catechol 2,3-dioxygenase-like lactoylglutathione lyase family enzyme